MNKIIKLSVTLLLFTASLTTQSCGNTEPQKQQENTEKKFTLPAIPAVLTTPGQRVEFLLLNYWNNFNYADTSLINNADYT